MLDSQDQETMINWETKKIIILATKWGGFIGGVPFTWSDQKCKAVENSSAQRKWTVMAIYQVIYSIFVFIRTSQVAHSFSKYGTVDRLELFKACVMVIGVILFCSYYWVFVNNKRAYIAWMNFYLREFERCRSKLIKTEIYT